MVLCVAKDATTRRRHWREFPMTSIFGGGFPAENHGLRVQK